jgi:Condensation domain
MLYLAKFLLVEVSTILLQFAVLLTSILDAPIRDINSMTGICINTVARRVILNSAATVLETLRQIQSDQIDISKHENIALSDLQSEGISVSGLFKTILNFRNLPSNQDVDDLSSSTGDSLFAKNRSNARDGYVLCLHYFIFLY